MLTVREATLQDLGGVASLFDAYRQFYELPADEPAARAYIQARLTARDSVVLVAADDVTQALRGFCQLYPSRCSLLAAPIYILYDLYVDPRARGAGAGKALMLAAAERARRDGKARMELQTARNNQTARALYDSLGWKLDETYLTYTLPVS
jgi:ribosomal protein S18 acetylase RimI-like enzyme